MNRLSILIFSMLLLHGVPLHASIDAYDFDNEQQRESYLALIRELRCPKCQNQDIADSNAPIAQDMRAAVLRLLQEGKSHNEIVDYMVERFGEFVSYKPKLSPDTYLLWFGPWVLLAGGVLIVVMIGKRRAASASSQAPTSLSAEEKARLDALIARHENKPEDKD